MISSKAARIAVVAVLATTAGSFAVDAATAATGSVPRCTTSDLSLSHTRQDIGAGNGVENLVFTNTSSHTCRLDGFPGVAYVGKSGKQIGAAADRMGSAYSAVLVSGGKAHATLHFINNAGAVPGCDMTTIRRTVGERVYPPNSTLAMFVRDPHYACTDKHAHLLQTESVRSSR